ncbi:MAG: efflux RND transporter permease subunit, partial [Planctomycetales bacterium]
AGLIKEKVAELRLKYPHVEFSATRDVSEEIHLMFSILGSSALFGGALVLVILCATMGFRVAALVLTAIPFSTAVAIIFLYAMDVPVSNMMIFSYILVLGVVVDGAIIVAENIYRHLERGETPVEAAKKGIDEVGIPVLAADLTTVAAFLPMLLVPGIMGDFMGVMPKVVAVALLGSVLVDHFLIPVAASMWPQRIRSRQQPATPSDPETPSNSTSNPSKAGSFSRNLFLPMTMVARLFAAAYEATLRFSLSQRWVIVIGCGYAVGWAYLMIQSGAIHLDFFPPSDRGQFEVNFETPLGYSIEETARAAKTITDPLLELRETGELKHIVTALGSSSAIAGALHGDNALGPEFGKILVELVPATERERHQDVIINELRNKIRPYPGMKFSIRSVQEGPPGGSAVELRLLGDDLDRLGDLANQLTEDLRGLKATVDVRTNYRPDNPEIVIDPDSDVLGLMGMTKLQVAEYVSAAVLGDSRLEMILDDEEIPIRIQMVPEFQQSPEDIRRLMIVTREGRRMTVGELGEVRRE